MNENIGFDISNEPIVISKYTLDMLLKTEKPGDSIALYTFLYYTAKWQKTNSIKATTSYIMKGLKWTQRKATKNKKVLIALGLIKNVKRFSTKNKGWYIEIKFIWSKDSVDKIADSTTETQDMQKRTSSKIGKKEDLQKCSTNALRVNNKNPLSVINEKSHDDKILENLKIIKSVVPPSIENVILLFKIKKYNSNPELYFNHYQSISWKKGFNKITDWIANAATWELNQPVQKQYDTIVNNNSFEKLKSSAV